MISSKFTYFLSLTLRQYTIILTTENSSMMEMNFTIKLSRLLILNLREKIKKIIIL